MLLQLHLSQVVLGGTRKRTSFQHKYLNKRSHDYTVRKKEPEVRLYICLCAGLANGMALSLETWKGKYWGTGDREV